MKTKWLQLSAVLLVSFVFALRGRAADEAAAAPGAGWKTFTDPESRFSILMPADPQVTNDAKEGYTSHIYMAKEGSNLYLAGVTLYDPKSYDPSASPDKIEAELAADRDNFNKEVNAHTTGSKRREFGGHPAIEFTSASEQANFSGLAVLVGGHCYMVVSAYHTAEAPPEVVRFFDSFKLLTP
ncbi:MAG TPA: hypothetical protein VMI53_09645 [Opitutaceae bacterium]|nr:hypothetical protein [Opitutaceae bacterium]